MADLFVNPDYFKNSGNGPVPSYTGNPEVDRELDLMPEEERQQAIAEITAPPTGEEIAGMISSKLAVGEVPDVSVEDYRLYKAFVKTKETDVMEAIGMGAEMVYEDLTRAAGSMWDDPVSGLSKLTPSIIEAFSQGTRGLYGMAAQSQDPNSVLFRVKNALYADGSDEQAEYQQFMEALDFNAKTTRLMSGKETLVMDKDLINPEVTQAMSYIADPSLFIPFGGIAAKGAKLVGMAEGLAKAAAKAEAIKSMVIGGAIKWGVGAPIEFIGGATRSTIDGALERGSRLIEAGTGLSAQELQATARMSGLGTVASGLAGYPVDYATGVSQAYIGATAARGFGEAIGAVGEQMMRGNRGVRSYAAQALRESGKNLSPHARNLLTVLDNFDPMFSYGGDIVNGVAQGAVIGGGLGYLSGGVEGMGQGIGAGGVLGGTGAAFGRIVSDITGATRRERMRITADIVMNGLRDINPTKFKDFATLKAAAEARGINIDGYIGGFDTLTPDLNTYFRTVEQHKAEIRARGFDPEKYDGSFVDENGRRMFSVEEFSKAEGFVIDKAKDGNITLGINLDNLYKNTVPHEAFHAIFRSVLMQPEFQKRLTENVLGIFDKSGKMIEPPKVSKDDAVGFFNRYLKALYKGDTLAKKQELLNQALTEYYRDGQTTVMDTDGKTPFLSAMSEEFGAYYFTQFIEGKPVDYLYLGGQYTGIRGLIESAKEGWIDYWQSKAKDQNPRFDINNPDGIDYAFKPKGGKRVRVSALDYFMRDLVRAAEQTNRDGSINLNRMSDGTREAFARANGLDGVISEKRGVFRRPSARGGVDTVKLYNKTYGPQVHKAILALPEAIRPRVDAEGNFVGPLSKEVLDHIVSTGLVSREMANKISLLQDMASGKHSSNMAEMGYVGWSMQTDTGPNPPRVYGDEVPYKRRKVLVLSVESKIGPKGMSFTAKTIDFKVIEARANNLWSDSNVRKYWNDNRAEFIQDFFRYLDNASKTTEQGRVPSAQLWAQDGNAKRDIMHQMAGIPRREGDTFVHAPIAEIHQDILNSVMNLTVNRMTDIRVTGDKVNFVSENADPFIRVNMKVAEMPFEDTPNGRVYTDSRSGFKFTESNGRIMAFDKDGEHIGTYSNKEEAQRLAMRVYERQQKAMKQIADELAEGTRRGITWKSRSQFIIDNSRLLKDENIKAQFIKQLEEYANSQWGDDTTRLAKKHIEIIKKEGFTKEILDHEWFVPVEYNGQEVAFRTILSEETAPLSAKWNEQFPQTFRSGLLDKIKALHKQNPNLTHQGLLKKLLRDGSSGSRFWAEADAIGLIKHLREKITPSTRIQKIRDAQGNWTGGIKEASMPVFSKKDNQGNVIGGRLDTIDMVEIETFIKDNGITLTPEIGAKSNMSDTSLYTADGAKSGYNETAVRINKQYAHGVSGHYGPDVIVHHRSTLRPDREGNSVRFIEEIQANNAKEAKDKKLLTEKEVAQTKTDIADGKQLRELLIKEGAIVENEGMLSWPVRLFHNEEIPMRLSELTSNPEFSRRYAKLAQDSFLIMEGDLSKVSDKLLADYIHPYVKQGINDALDVIGTTLDREGGKAETITAKDTFELFKNKDIKSIETLFNPANESTISIVFNTPETFAMLKRFVELRLKTKEAIDKAQPIFDRSFRWDRSDVFQPHFIDTRLRDFETRLQQNEIAKKAGVKLPPLTEISEWSAVAVKDIIRQAVMNGEDMLTLTHPDDTPAECGMKQDARNDDYGRIFPDVIRKIVEPYGIEVKVRNEIGELAQKSPELIKATNEKTAAQQRVLEEFQKTQGAGEDPSVIKALSEQLAKPVHEVAKDIGEWSREADALRRQVRNEVLSENIIKAMDAARKEAETFEEANNRVTRQLDPSALAIDRGTSFTLNDEIKRAVRNGELSTAYKPKEDGAEGRRYAPNIITEKPTPKFGGKFRRNLSSKDFAEAEGSSTVTPTLKERYFDQTKFTQEDISSRILDAADAIEYHERRLDASDALTRERAVAGIKEEKAKIEELRTIANDAGIGTTEFSSLLEGRNPNKKKRLNTERLKPSEEGQSMSYGDSESDKASLIKTIKNIVSKSGLKPQEKTIHEIWTRAFEDDIDSALEMINEEGIDAWMRHRAQQIVDAEVESWDSSYKSLKNQQKIAEKFLETSYDKPSEEGQRPSERFMPAEYQGGDDYWKPKKNPFESKDEQGFLIRAPNISKTANTPSGKKFEINPDNVAWDSIGHHKRLTKEETGGMTHEQIFNWENENMGLWAEKTSDEKILTKNKISPRELGFSYTHREWFQQSLAGIENNKWGRYERPIYDKDGNLIRRGRISITSQYRGQIKNMKHAYEIKNRIAEKLKFNPEDADAYLFDASDSIKQSMGLSAKDTLPIRFKVDDEVKKNIRSLQSAIDRQADKDRVPAKIRANIGRLIQAIERQKTEDINDGFRALSKAVDEQADNDNVPVAIRQGLRRLMEAAQYEDLKPRKPMPKPTATEEQLVSGLEALGKAVGVKGKVRRSEAPRGQAREVPAPAPEQAAPAPRPVVEEKPSSSVWRSWTYEKTAEGGVFSNALGYMIMVHRGKFKLYNPQNTLVGIYTDVEQAKRRILRDAPKQ